MLYFVEAALVYLEDLLISPEITAPMPIFDSSMINFSTCKGKGAESATPESIGLTSTAKLNPCYVTSAGLNYLFI